ncbi:aldolase catalytic domain-containing protein [Campylobacter sp. 2018MI35]|uniref:aldolase catalytic domain-containing protein n=1 Tax=Campylobacter sp. 2018MI34 TaxID=2800582 RepID=UPI001907059F|nr:aldolase catalytic domain-containing protein [Campylobacter sp. 2018MI34]MBK1992436.1 aldolase catalytic domain-containing protein [Campylobacter sp. 2018MI34]
MSHLKILDCTLRDGAYLVDKYFGNLNIKGIIQSLVNANIDIIEIGFLQNEGFGDGKTVFKQPLDAFRFLPKNTKKSNFALLADYSRYDFNQLPKYNNSPINSIRICFFKHERFKALEVAKDTIKKGYQVFIQPVDILGYNDKELIELIELVNQTKSYCLSIVDTFGSMYIEDLRRIYYLFNFNLKKNIKIGFHSHNNLQLSSALSQEFARITQNERKIIIDTSLNGLGRGAGNTPTELIALYANQKMSNHYLINFILDCIDIYITPISSKCNWGYSLPYYIAGMFGAHTNNIIYLLKKNNILSNDIAQILSIIDNEKIKRYDYDLLETLYLQYINKNIDDLKDFENLGQILSNKNILILAPGISLYKEQDKILRYQKEKKCLLININFIDDKFKSEFIYTSNLKRYTYLQHNPNFLKYRKILLSNIKEEKDNNTFKININRVIKKGWKNLDNSIILLLRLLDNFNLKSLTIAGFDGFNSKENNYFQDDMENNFTNQDTNQLNNELESMFCDFLEYRNSTYKIHIITQTYLNLPNGITHVNHI